MSEIDLLFGDVSGSGGGGGSGKGGSSGNSNESPNTLRSDNRALLLELISEGPCLGLVNGGTSIYLNETPVVNANGSANFRGVQWDYRLGTPDQQAIAGNSQVETPFAVGVKVTTYLPATRTIVDANVSAVRVVVQIPALAITKSDGTIQPNSVQYQIQLRPVNGAWVTAAQVDILNEKTTSPYQRATIVNLPANGAPWDIKVVRLTPDSNTVENQCDTIWDSYTEIVAGSFIYPHSALVYLNIDAALFNTTSIPNRSYDWYGLIIQVPSNYDPVARTYTGIWDGTFKAAWTNNPAWIFYDIITNDRYGLGQFVDAAKIDKWSLYQIAQYCDQLVPDGYGGMEPRYTFNAHITKRDDAYRVLQAITAAWRGMAYWSLGQVFATIDAPKDPVKLVSPANVIGGHFTYSGTALKARHSVAIVHWSDPHDFYRPAVEIVVNNAMVNRYGWREVQVQATGCTSRSLAHRYGKWILDTEENETETVTYQASWDHATVRPGDIITVADPGKAGTRTGGRLVAIGPNAQTLVLDKPFTPVAGSTYTLMIEGPNGKIQSKQIAQFLPDGSVVLAQGLNPAPAPGAMWVISGTDVVPRRYNVLSTKEDAKNLFTITALFNDPNKYARVEQGVYFQKPPYTRPVSTIKEPTNFDAKEALYQIDGHFRSRILLSWTPGDDFQSKQFHLTATTPKGQVDYGLINTPSFDVENSAIGTYIFTLFAIGISGQLSSIVTKTIDVKGWQSVNAPYVSGLEIQGQGANTKFTGQNVTVDWVNNFPKSGYDIAQDRIAGAGTKNPFYRDNVVTIFDASGNKLRSEVITTDVYTYDYSKNASDSQAFGLSAQRDLTFSVEVRNTLGAISAPDVLKVSNPVPEMVMPSVTGGLDSVFVSYVVPRDADYLGALIWMSEDPNFNPLTTTPAYDGPNTAISIPAGNLKVYYVRLACYDAFGRTGLNISPAVQAFTGNRLFDTSPPAVPGNLKLVAQKHTMPTGEVVSELVATWDASTSSNFGYFSVEIRDHDAQNWIASNTDKPTYVWTNLIAGKTYNIQVRAYSVAGFPSNYAVAADFVMPPKNSPPGPPTSLSTLASLRSIFINWVNPTDPDLAFVEIYQSATPNFVDAIRIGSSQGNGFTVSGILSSVPLWFWIRAVNTSSLASSFVGPIREVPGLALTRDIAPLAITTPLIDTSAITETKIANDAITTPKLQAAAITAEKMAANSVTAAAILASTITADQIAANTIKGFNIAAKTIAGDNIVAGTITGDLVRAGTITGDLIKVDTSLPPTITIGVTGVTMGATASPGTLVNSQSVRIDPGKILIAGNTSLADWRNGTDVTKIEGGSIAANTIAANKLTIGSRGITISELQFGYDKAANTVTWTAGAIAWTGSDGLSKLVNIAAGSFQWTNVGQYPCAYVAWSEGSGLLAATQDLPSVTGGSWILLATYRGDNKLVATYGRTVIDGANIVAGTITANQLVVGQLITDSVQINGGIILNTHLAGNITFDKMAGGTLTATDAVKIGGDRFYLDAVNQQMVVRDGQAINDGSGHPGQSRLVIGNLGGGGKNYGMQAYDPAGVLIFSTGGVNASINGAYITSITADKIAAGTVKAALAAVTGSFDTYDTNNVLRARLGNNPGVDNGLFVWDAAGNLVMSSTGLTGTFIKDTTLGTTKIINNAVSLTSGAFIASGGSPSVSMNFDIVSQVTIIFTCSVTAGNNSIGNALLFIDNNKIYETQVVSTASSSLGTTASMSYTLSVQPGNHSFQVNIVGIKGAISVVNSNLTVIALKK